MTKACEECENETALTHSWGKYTVKCTDRWQLDVWLTLHCAEAKDENNQLTDKVKQLSHKIQAGLKRTLSPSQDINTPQRTLFPSQDVSTPPLWELCAKCLLCCCNQCVMTLMMLILGEGGGMMCQAGYCLLQPIGLGVSTLLLLLECEFDFGWGRGSCVSGWLPLTATHWWEVSTLLECAMTLIQDT